GLGLGMTLIRYRNEFSHWLASTLHIEIFPREVYQFSEIPAQIVPQDVWIICLSAFLICSFAALIPAYFAARLDPVKALRYECFYLLLLRACRAVAWQRRVLLLLIEFNA